MLSYGPFHYGAYGLLGHKYRSFPQNRVPRRAAVCPAELSAKLCKLNLTGFSLDFVFLRLEKASLQWCGSPSRVCVTSEFICITSHVQSMLSRVQFFATPWTVACRAPLSMEFSRQEYWRRLACPPPGDLPDPGIELGLLHCRTILYHLSHTEKPYHSVLTLPQVPYIWYLPIWTTTIKGRYYSYPRCGVKKKAQGVK